ncbi:TPA: hypothetical protein ACX6Q6_003013 [Photobacterium damselae]
MKKNSIIDNLNIQPLSESLQNFLALATKTEDQELIKWAKCELTGYNNNEMTDEDIVPQYREVSGYHTNDLRQKLVLPREDMQFINTTRIRNSVVELENYQEHGLIMKDSNMCKIIHDSLDVHVTSFHVSASQVKQVLANVKCELISRLSRLKEHQNTMSLSNEDIIEFKPNFYGIGFNLNALKRKWFSKRNE